MRTTRKKLNTRIYWANQAQSYITKAINYCINEYNNKDKFSNNLNLAYQDLEMSWSNCSENVTRKFKPSVIRGKQKLINHLIIINQYITKYIKELNDIDSFYYTNHHIEIDRDLGKYYHYKAITLLDEILREVK